MYLHGAVIDILFHCIKSTVYFYWKLGLYSACSHRDFFPSLKETKLKEKDA